MTKLIAKAVRQPAVLLNSAVVLGCALVVILARDPLPFL